MELKEMSQNSNYICKVKRSQRIGLIVNVD